MSGLKKDRRTQKELEQALVASLEQLEQTVAAGQRKVESPEVAEELNQLIESLSKSKPRRPRARKKK